MRVLVAFVLLCLLGNVHAQTTTLILVRHAEKANDGTKDPDLSEPGIKRSHQLAALLEKTDLSAIYTTNYKRTKATVAPIAAKKKLEPILYEANKEPELRTILEKNSGKTILLVGHSNTVPWTVNYLTGSKLENFGDNEFGNILIVTVSDIKKTGQSNTTTTWLSY